MIASALEVLASHLPTQWRGSVLSPQLAPAQEANPAPSNESNAQATTPATDFHFTRGYKRKHLLCSPDSAVHVSASTSGSSIGKCSALLQLSKPPAAAQHALPQGHGAGAGDVQLGRLLLTPVGSPAPLSAPKPKPVPARKHRATDTTRSQAENASTASASGDSSSSSAAAEGSRKSARIGGSAPRLEDISFDLPVLPAADAGTMCSADKLAVVLRLLRAQAVESVKSLSTHLQLGMAGELTTDSVLSVLTTAAALDVPSTGGEGSPTRVFLDAGCGCGRPVFMACLSSTTTTTAPGPGAEPLYDRAVGVELVQAQVSTATSIARHVGLSAPLCEFHRLDMEDGALPWPAAARQATTVYSFSKGMPPAVLQAVSQALNGSGPAAWRVLATTTSPREWAQHGLRYCYTAAQRVHGKMVGSGSGHMVYFLLSSRAQVPAGAVPHHAPEPDSDPALASASASASGECAHGGAGQCAMDGGDGRGTRFA